MVSCAVLRLCLATVIIIYCSSFQAYNDSIVNNLFEPAEPFLSEFFHNHQSVVWAWSFFSSVLKFARIPGVFISIILSDRIGRKMTTALGCIFYVIGALFTCTLEQSHSYWLGALGRAFMGLAAGTIRTASSLWLIECAPLNRRGLFASLSLAGASLGGLTAYIVTLPQLLGTSTMWPTAVSLSCFPIVLLLPVTLFYLKESPRYLYLQRNQHQLAKKALEFYQGPEHVNQSWEDLQEEQRKHTDTVSYVDLFWKEKQLYRPFVLCLVLTMKGLLGAIPMMVYSTELFHLAGLTYSTAAVCTVIAAIPRLIPGFLIPFTIDKVGRRPLLLVGSSGYTVCLIILLLLFLSLSPCPTRGYIVALVASTSWCFDAAFEHNTVACELMPLKARAKAIGACAIIGNLTFAVEFLVILPMYHGLGLPWTLGILIFNSCVWLLYMYRNLPETKMKTFGQIARLFDHEEEHALLA